MQFDSRGSDDSVEEVKRDENDRGESQTQAHDLSVPGEYVVVIIRQWRVLNDREYQKTLERKIHICTYMFFNRTPMLGESTDSLFWEAMIKLFALLFFQVYHSDSGRKDSPAYFEPDPNLPSHHVLHVPVPLVHTVDPGDGNALKEAETQKDEATRGVVVKNLENVNAALKRRRHTYVIKPTGIEN